MIVVTLVASRQYTELWKAVIRPPRDHYEIKAQIRKQLAVASWIFRQTQFRGKKLSSQDLGPPVFSIECDSQF